MRALLLLLLAADGGSTLISTPVWTIPDVMLTNPPLWESDISCGNGATPHVAKGRLPRALHIVCDNRQDGG